MSGARGLWSVVEALREREFIDLSHEFHAGIPCAEDMPAESSSVLYNHQQHGFMTHRYCFVGQWGTHVDPPAHFLDGGRTISEISVKEMVLPLAVIDLEDKCTNDPEYQLRPQDLESWIARNGPFPQDAFLVFKSGWAKRWPNHSQMRNAAASGQWRSPGWSVEAIQWALTNVLPIAFGHETLDTDAGALVQQGLFPAERAILANDKWQIELLGNLERVPETGALAVVAFPNARGGSGFPARVIAVLP